jgi:TRAP transporter TAXI family solute receptor
MKDVRQASPEGEEDSRGADLRDEAMPLRRSGGAAGRRSALFGIAAAFCVVAGAAPAFAQSAAAPQIFRIDTASKAGTFYPIGSLIAEGITDGGDCGSADGCGVPGVIAIAQVSNGSVANVGSVSAGSVEAGLAQADVIYWAYNAEGRFAGETPLGNLRAVANLYPGSLHIVTAADSGITAVEDLRGKRVALDEPGSGTLATAELILAAAGIGTGELSPLYIKHNHAGPMLAKGELDAFFFVAGFPTSSVLEVSKTTPIRLVPLSERIIGELSAERPYLAPGVIPAGAYPGVDADVATVDIGTQLIVRDELDADLVRAILGAMWNGRTRKLLKEGHPKGSQVQLGTALKGIAIPLHDGAAQFYRDAGLTVD